MVKSSSDLPLEPIPVHGDEGKLRQVLINFLGNAVKFTDTGNVTLRVVRTRSTAFLESAPETQEETKVKSAAAGLSICAAQTESGARWNASIPATDNSQLSTFTFEITDSGPGIPAELQEKLFAPFVQGGEGVRKGGTGLGLAISRRLVQLMGGTIGLRSAAGEGSTFSFTVPLAPASTKLVEQAAPEMREPSRLAAGFAVNALIVDDIEQNREVLFQILSSLGCQAWVAESGARALELMGLEIPDIVFTDARMPGMSGFELRTRIVEQFGA